jgi:hypothetical protein
MILARGAGKITSETLYFLETGRPQAAGQGVFQLPPEGISLE